MTDHDNAALKAFVRQSVAASFEGGAAPGTTRPDTASYGASTAPFEGLGYEPPRESIDAGLVDDAEDEASADETAGDDESDDGRVSDEERAAAAWATLSDADRQAVAEGDLDLWDRRVAAYEEQGDEGDEDDGDGEALADAAREASPGRAFVESVLADPDMDDETAATYLEWAAVTASRQEWTEACREVGWPVAQRPSYADLPQALQVRHHANFLDDRLAAIREGRARPL